MSVVEGGNIVRPEPLGDSDHCSVDDTDAKIGVGTNQFGHAKKVFPVDRIAVKRCFGHRPKIAGIGDGAEELADQAGGLSEDQLRNDKHCRCLFKSAADRAWSART